jgi:capsular exopolysaccharide synthesis family protein
MGPCDADLPQPARNRPDAESSATIPIRGRHPAATSFGDPAVWRGGRPGLPPALSSGPDAKALLKALGRRWPMALGLGAVVAALAATAAWFLLSPKYTSFAQLRIAFTQPRIAFRTADSADGRLDSVTYQKTQAAAVKGRFVLNAAMKKDDVKRLRLINQQPDPIAWLEEELKVDVKENSEIVTVTLEGEDPDELVILLNALTQAYLQEVKNEERKLRSDRVAELDDILTKTKEKLRTKRETLRKRADELGTGDSTALNQKQLVLLQTHSDLRRQLSTSQFESLRAQARLAIHKSRSALLDNPAQAEAAIGEAMELDPKGKGLASRVTQLERLVMEYERTAVSPTEHGLLVARRRLDSTRRDLETRQAEVRKTVLARLQQKVRGDYESGLAQIQEEINLLTEQEKNLQAQVQAMAKDMGEIGKTSTELDMLREDIKRDEKVCDTVGSELEALQVELRSPDRVSLYQEAAIQKKDMKKQLFGVIAAPILALLGVCLAVAWLENRTQKIYTADEVVRGLGMRVVGAVPPLPSPVLANLAGAEDGTGEWDETSLESIDAIRTLLIRDASLQRTRVVMVTSAVVGEGKTTLAGHLAGSLARAGRKTLLVDCDLRCPAAHQLFEVTLQPGFSEVLLGEVPVDDAIHETPMDGLWLVPAGHWDREVIQALAKDGVDKAFERFKEQFDFIVVDSHPVLAATDSLLIGQHVDAVILSLLRDVSQAPRVYAAGQRLSSLGIRVLGAVVNGMGRDDLYVSGYQTPASVAG